MSWTGRSGVGWRTAGAVVAAAAAGGGAAAAVAGRRPGR